MNEDVRMDWEREVRTGIAEAVFCASKTAEQIDRIVREAQARNHPLLLTRLDRERFQALAPAVREALDFDGPSHTATYGQVARTMRTGLVAIVCAGTSDMRVALEARKALAFSGIEAPVIADVGVAGLWRLTERIAEIAGYSIVIAVAGMEGALFSVIAGAIPGLVIAVPTSVGYGVALGGAAALHSALASCSPGIATVNIDNGFGAACVALKALRAATSSN